MDSRAKLFGHPIHQMLIVFPLGLLAAPFGAIDWLAIPPGTRAKRIGALHGVGNVVVVLLFAVSWLLRWDAPALPETLALAMSFAGGFLALGTGWLGGELVDRLAIGVDEGAHPDAPSSLSVRASEPDRRGMERRS